MGNSLVSLQRTQVAFPLEPTCQRDVAAMQRRQPVVDCFERDCFTREGLGEKHGLIAAPNCSDRDDPARLPVAWILDFGQATGGSRVASHRRSFRAPQYGLRRRAGTTCWTSSASTAAGDACGRHERSSRPAGPAVS